MSLDFAVPILAPDTKKTDFSDAIVFVARISKGVVPWLQETMDRHQVKSHVFCLVCVSLSELAARPRFVSHAVMILRVQAFQCQHWFLGFVQSCHVLRMPHVQTLRKELTGP